jgi:hypothetical protein
MARTFGHDGGGVVLTPTEIKEIRAVLCEMAARGCIGAQMDRAKKDLIDQFLALKAATTKPAATTK